MTLQDIANEIGISVSTVSRVLNLDNPSAASKELQDKIKDLAQKGNYIPGRTAKKNRKINTHNKLILCLFTRDNPHTNDNPYVMEVAHHFENSPLLKHYAIQNIYIDYSNQNEKIILPSTNIEGVVIIGRHSKKLISKVKEKTNNIVYIGLNPPACEGYDTVTSDAYSMAKTAVKHLINQHHTKIAFIGDIQNEIRYKGYCDMLKEANLDLDPSYIIETSTSMKSGYFAMKNLISLKNKPTAVFCMNDSLAIGAIKAINDANVSIAIIGIDDIEASSFTTPKLTTIHSPSKEQGKLAAKILIDRINGGHEINLSVSLPFYLIERDSCKKAY